MNESKVPLQGFYGPVTSLAVRVRAFVYFPGQRVARVLPVQIYTAAPTCAASQTPQHIPAARC